MYSKIKKLVDSHSFQNFIIALIVLNGITMGFETSKTFMADFGHLIKIFNAFVITVFTIEIILRIYVYRVSFFKDIWSLFDFFVVGISLVPAGEGLEILRVLRVLRLFRLITVIPQMRKVVAALGSVIPGMASIAAILVLFFYVFAIMATQLFGEKFPEWFGTLGESFYTLFQIMTLESWSMGIVRPIMEVYPLAWIFFIIFIFIATFIMVNLIVAIVVDAMSQINHEEEEHIIGALDATEQHTIEEIKALRGEISELKEMISTLQKP
ncbi:MAG: ion transporter [Epsilonproteobacteria bacterium]|nr:ion transporter [Campylobacterota bacterium]